MNVCVCLWERLMDRKIDLGKSSSWRLPRHLLICPSIIDTHTLTIHHTPSLYKPAEFFMSRALHLLRVECLQSGKYPIFTPCCVCHFLPSLADTLHEGSCLQRAGSLRISVRAGRACDALRYILRRVSAWGGFCYCFDTIYASRNCSSSFFKLTDRQYSIDDSAVSTGGLNRGTSDFLEYFELSPFNLAKIVQVPFIPLSVVLLL